MLDGFSNGEGENPLLFSLTAERGGGGGGWGGMPCPLPSRPPPPRQPFQPSPTPSPASHQETFQNDEKLFQRGLQRPPGASRGLRTIASYLHSSHFPETGGASVGSALLPREPWRVGATHYSFQDTDTPSAFVSSQAQPLQSKLDARLA